MSTILKGGDGYTFDVNRNIGGLMGRSRYSYNYAPIYNGELLQNGGNNNNECECSSKKKEENLYNMLKQEGGFKTGGNQLDAIQYVSKSLSSLNINSIISLISLIFVYEIYTKNGKMHNTIKKGGSNVSQIMAPLGRSNLIVLAALLLLHHFAIEMPENKKSLKGGNNIESQISELLKPLGVNKNGVSSLLTSIKQAFGFKEKNNYKITHKNESSKNDFNGGGCILKNIIAPLGTNAFIATGLLIILEKVLNKEKLEKKDSVDKINKPKTGGNKNKDFQKLVDVITPLSFNIFANKSFIQTLLKKEKEKQDNKINKTNKLSGGRGLPLPGFIGHSLNGLGASGMDLNNFKGGKKIIKISKKKVMKGGEESWGATGMPPQFYDPKTELISYPFNSGVGVKTAYGLQEPLDVGRGMLAPNTTSKSSSANNATSMKTGGSKKNSKITKTTKIKKNNKIIK